MSADKGRAGPRAASWIGRHPRWLGALALALVLALLAGAATAYHFSSAVLVPDQSAWPADTSVIEVFQDRIVLERGGGAERPGIYGLNWSGGHAIVGEVLGTAGDQVTRRLRASSGYLVAGMKVAFDPRVYGSDPRQALGLRYADVGVPDELGPMPAWLVPGRSATWAIVVHGINDDRRVGLRILPTLHRSGLPTLLISYRDDLGAPPSPDGLHHMGLTEWRDVEAAVEFALGHGAKRVVLVGYSMAAPSSPSSCSARGWRRRRPGWCWTRPPSTGARSSSSTQSRWACRRSSPSRWFGPSTHVSIPIGGAWTPSITRRTSDSRSCSSTARTTLWSHPRPATPSPRSFRSG